MEKEREYQGKLSTSSDINFVIPVGEHDVWQRYYALLHKINKFIDGNYVGVTHDDIVDTRAELLNVMDETRQDGSFKLTLRAWRVANEKQAILKRKIEVTVGRSKNVQF